MAQGNEAIADSARTRSRTVGQLAGAQFAAAVGDVCAVVTIQFYLPENPIIWALYLGAAAVECGVGVWLLRTRKWAYVRAVSWHVIVAAVLGVMLMATANADAHHPAVGMVPNIQTIMLTWVVGPLLAVHCLVLLGLAGICVVAYYTQRTARRTTGAAERPPAEAGPSAFLEEHRDEELTP